MHQFLMADAAPSGTLSLIIAIAAPHECGSDAH